MFPGKRPLVVPVRDPDDRRYPPVLAHAWHVVVVNDVVSIQAHGSGGSWLAYSATCVDGSARR